MRANGRWPAAWSFLSALGVNCRSGCSDSGSVTTSSSPDPVWSGWAFVFGASSATPPELRGFLRRLLFAFFTALGPSSPSVTASRSSRSNISGPFEASPSASVRRTVRFPVFVSAPVSQFRVFICHAVGCGALESGVFCCAPRFGAASKTTVP